MKLTPEQYQKMSKQASPPSTLAKDCLWAFLVGGAICTLGQGLNTLYTALGCAEKPAATWVSVSLVALSALFTSLGWYQKLAARAGAGTLVPITGFANAVVSPAIEFRPEGLIMGTAARMFTIAGPVLVYGTLAAALYGVVVYLMMLF